MNKNQKGSGARSRRPFGKPADDAQLKQKIAELTDALQRERADAMNVRRRAEEDRSKMAKFYKAETVRELLPALDNLDRSLKHIPKDLKDHDYIKGVQGVVKQFEQALSQIGVQKIKTVGEEFDPKLHDAVHMEDGEGQVEVICEELQPGYKVDNEVIRHAMVKVKMEKQDAR